MSGSRVGENEPLRPLGRGLRRCAIWILALVGTLFLTPNVWAQG